MPATTDDIPSPNPEEFDDSAATEQEAAFLSVGEDQRKWLLCLFKLSATRYDDSHPDVQVELSYRSMLINVYERMNRILRSDLPRETQ